MRGNIYDKSTGKYVGLNDFVYTTQPVNNADFKYSVEEELYVEPQNIIEEVKTIFDTLAKK